MKPRGQAHREKKIRVAILFGGKSAEHEVSLKSAKNVFQAIDKKKYDVALIGIDKKGRWLLQNDPRMLLGGTNGPKLLKEGATMAVTPGTERKLELPYPGSSIDVVFPVLHGPFGEDGTVQGLLKLAGVPFVGASVLGSAIGMDKDVSKRLLRDAGISVAKFISVSRSDDPPRYDSAVKALGTPFFVKPANLGSSVGITKVKNKVRFKKALKNAFSYDNKILLEEFIKGRELECSVLGNDKPIASVAGEVIPKHEFYSYEAKYLDENGAVLEIPAKISGPILKNVQSTAVKAFKILCCEGMARVDFFLRDDGKLFLNEINTIPGFTKISMYPKLWEASRVSYGELVDKLIGFALERFEREERLKVSYDS